MILRLHAVAKFKQFAFRISSSRARLQCGFLELVEITCFYYLNFWELRHANAKILQAFRVFLPEIVEIWQEFIKFLPAYAALWQAWGKFLHEIIGFLLSFAVILHDSDERMEI